MLGDPNGDSLRFIPSPDYIGPFLNRGSKSFGFYDFARTGIDNEYSVLVSTDLFEGFPSFP